MFDFPLSTKIDKRIPKQKFYENLNINADLKQIFIDCIKQITWANKFAPSTLNIAEGTDVTEVEVFHMFLTNELPNDKVLRQIDQEIPYHILFVLELNGKFQLWIGYKESSLSQLKTFKFNSYYHTDWLNEADVSLKFEGLNIDAVYENLLRQIAGDKLVVTENGETLKKSVEKSIEIQKIKSEISRLEKAAWCEKQPSKKLEYHNKINFLKKTLEDLKNGQS